MVIIVTKAGNASEMSSSSIFLKASTISTPTMTSAPLVAAPGMSRKMGARKMLSMNIMPTKNEVRPDLPPSAMPDALST